MSPAFELSKWYGDCVSEDGGALILYHARLRWHSPAIHYSNLLIRKVGQAVHNRYSLRRQPVPSHDRSVEWEAPVWNVKGRWATTGPGIRETLFESPAGSVEWNCIAPRSSVEVHIGETKPHFGPGYVEHLKLTIPPWRLPIRELRWGRFVNAGDALVWIDWRGPYNKQVIYHNGVAVSARLIDDREIAFGGSGAVLSLDTGTILREGALGATALSVLPNLDRLFPAPILGIRECKWLSRAVLRRPGREDSAGWAIHEVVEWP